MIIIGFNCNINFLAVPIASESCLKGLQTKIPLRQTNGSIAHHSKALLFTTGIPMGFNVLLAAPLQIPLQGS